MKTYKQYEEAVKKIEDLRKQGIKIIDDEFFHMADGRYVLIHIVSEKNPFPISVLELTDKSISKNYIYVLSYLYK